MRQELANFQKEKQLLVSLSRTRIDNKLENHISKLVQSGINWEHLYYISLSNGVLPLVFSALNKCCAPHVPKNISEKFKNDARKIAASNLSMSGLLLRLLALFKQHDILLIPFKGPLLACSIYGNVSLRSFCDLDVLVRPSDLPLAYTLLHETGYVPDIKLTQSQLAQFVKTEDNISFIHSGSGIIVELHWELSGNYLPQPITIDTILPRIVEDTLLDHTVQSMGNEDLLIYLCVHGSKHIWQRLEWICCLHELICSKNSLDWDLVLQLAEQWSATRMLAIGVLTTEQLFNTPIPQKTSLILHEDTKAKEMTSLIVALYEGVNTGKKGKRTGSRFTFWQLECAGSIRGAMRVMIAMLFFPTIEDWRRTPLPARLSFLYYLLRPLRLSWEVLKKGY